ncbi:hypothetical protein Tco_0534552 [Tanacetum coccineum]
MGGRCAGVGQSVVLSWIKLGLLDTSSHLSEERQHRFSRMVWEAYLRGLLAFSVRIIPGPAGILQAAKLSKTTYIMEGGHERHLEEIWRKPDKMTIWLEDGLKNQDQSVETASGKLVTPSESHSDDV